MENINKSILKLAVPSILANVTVPLVGLVDMAVAGHLGTAGTLETASLIGGIAVGTMLFDLLYWNFGFLRAGTGGLVAQAYGGGDGPEDWVGAYNIVLNNISWREHASKAVIHIADAPAHGEEWGGKDKHPEQGKLLIPLIRQTANRDIFFQGILIGKYAKDSFSKIQDIYRAEGHDSKARVAKFDENSVSASDFLENVAREVLLTIAKSD